MKFLALAAMLFIHCTVASAQDFAQPLRTALQEARARGCGVRPGVDAPLRWSAALARAATRIGQGEAALAAVEHEGVRATRVFHSNFVGYRTPDDVARALAGHDCSALADPKFTEVGAWRDGSHWLVVLVSPLALPQLADAHAAAARVLALTHEARSHARRCGARDFAPAAPLRWNGQLELAASMHARDMAANVFLNHTGGDGSTPGQRVTRAGYKWRSVGENIASGQHSPQEVVDDWIASPGHCANLMEPSFTEMGAAFGVNMASDAAVYWAQEFGRPR